MQFQLVAYKKHMAVIDGPISDAFRKRNDSYNCILEILKLLHSIAISRKQNSLPAITSASSLFPSAAEALNPMTPSSATVEREKVIRKVLDSDDELANVAMFRWMMANGLSNYLLEVYGYFTLHYYLQNYFSTSQNSSNHFSFMKSNHLKAVNTWNSSGSIMKRMRTI